MNLLITICARGGSKGVPGKNIRPVADVPLIAYSIAHAQEFAAKVGGDVALTTDDPRIRDVAAEWGLVTDYLRPKEMATDLASKVPPMTHVLEYEEKRRGKKYDYTCDLDVTSPLRTMEDLELSWKKLQSRRDALNIYSISFPKHNPYTDMVEEDAEGFATLSKKSKTAFLSRQTAPKVYELNASFYFFRREFFEMNFPTQMTEKSLGYFVDHMCFEIDDPIEFEFLDYLLRNNKLDFDFSIPRPRALTHA